jgi:ribose 5-phosphate isomerase B
MRVGLRIALGADHAGVALKDNLARLLEERGIAYKDFGTHSPDSVDYPDFAAEVAQAVAAGDYDRGLLVCGSGIGMAIAANKVAGIRAAVVTEAESARLSRSHNDANVLALGARLTPPDVASDIVSAFLDTPFEGGRHQRRIDKLTQLDLSRPEVESSPLRKQRD